MNINRYFRGRVATVAVISAAALLLTACSAGGGGAVKSTTAADKTPIKIGVITPVSGPLATIGQAELNGVQIAVKLANAKGGINGHPIDLLQGDDQGTPATAVSVMQSLSSQGAKFFIGGISSPLCAALDDEANRLGTLNVTLSCLVGSLIDPQKNPMIYRVSDNNESLSAAVAYAMCNSKDLAGKATSFDYIGVNGATSTGQDAYLSRVLTRCNITPGTAVFTDSSATQMLPYATSLISKLPSNSKSTRVLVVAAAGAQQANLITTGLSTGLFDKYSYVIGLGEDVESFTAQSSLGQNMPKLNWVNRYYYDQKSALNDKFEPAYKKAFATEPPMVASEGFIAGQAMIAGLTKAKSVDPTTVNKVMVGLQVPGFNGDFKILPSHEAEGQEVQHTFGPDGTAFVAPITPSDVSKFDTPADHAFAVAQGI